MRSETEQPRHRGLVALAAGLGLGDLVILAASGIHALAERLTPDRPRLRDWSIEDAGSPAFIWRAFQAFLIAALLAATWRKTRESWPIVWVLLFTNLGLAILTRYHEDVGGTLADVVGVGSGSHWSELWMLSATSGLIAVAFATAPRAPVTRRLSLLTAAIFVSAFVFDAITDAAGRGSLAIVAAHVEESVELVTLGAAVLYVAHLYHSRHDEDTAPDDASDPSPS